MTGSDPKLDVLVTTWSGGGASQPAIGLGRLLVERGHRVRIVAPDALAGRITAAGCLPRPFPRGLEFDPGLGRAFEDQPAFARELFFGQALPDAVETEIAADHADLVVVDYLMRSVVCRAEGLAVPHALVMHMAHHHHAQPVTDDRSEWSQHWQYAQVNATRIELGLDPLPVGPSSVSVALAERAAAALVVMTEEFDRWPSPPPSVVHVGPIAEEVEGLDWDAPWAADDRRPLIIVSLSTMYVHQEAILRRVASSIATLNVRVLVLTGSELAPGEVAWPPGVHVRDYVPHRSVLPGAALVVTHGGMGTLMAAFAAGVPTLCLPLGRDQVANARKARALGASALLAPDSESAEIQRGVKAALASRTLRAGAKKMAGSVRGYRAGSRAVEVLERLGRAGQRQPGRALQLDISPISVSNTGPAT